MALAQVLQLLAALPLVVRAAEGNLSLDDDGDQAVCDVAEATDAQVMMLQTGISGQDLFLAEDDTLMVVKRNTTTANVSAIPVSTNPSEMNIGGWHSGNPNCPCIGIKNRTGEILVTLDGKQVPYSVDVGSSCQLWDYNHNPSCVGANAPLLDPAWCLQTWCFVDPCNCNLPGGVPKVSSYFPNSLSQDSGIYYSYETCGEQDLFTSAEHLNACTNQQTTTDCFRTSGCAWTLDRGCVGEELAGSACATNFVRNAAIWGFSDCACIGINNLTGSVDASIGNDTVSYPAATGSTCSAWDNENHPDCVNPSGPKPSWCEQKWCNVDPCTCLLDTPPKISTYFPGAKYLDHQIYYSYATCGETDTYTAANNPTACVNQMDEASCISQPNKCAWTLINQRYTCVGIDLATLCIGHRPTVKSGAPAAAGRALAAAAPLLAAAGLSGW